MPRAAWTPLLLATLVALSCQKPKPSVEPSGRGGAEPLAAGGGWVEAGDTAIDADPAPRAARVGTLSAWANDNLEGERFQVPIEPNDLILGVADARVTIVVFNDYQCPYCGRFDQALRDLASTYPTDVRLVIKQFPLPMHKQARGASKAVLAAHRQGRGADLHALIFANAGDLEREGLLRLAKRAQMPDMGRFEADLDDPALEAQIERDMALGAKLAVSSTPSYFINGTPERGAKSLDELEQLYLAEVEALAPLIQAGATRGEVYDALTARAPRERTKPARPTSASPTGKPDPAAHYAIDVSGHPSMGPDDALVTIVEFNDFECPYCRRVQATLAELRKRYGKDLRIVHFHNPLPFHKQAKSAALASLAAHRQGQFWPMHDRLFELAEQKGLSESAYEQAAKQLGLDLARFRKDLGDKALARQIDEDQAVANKLGAGGTPAFFINGRPMSGAQPVDNFAKLIDEEMTAAKAYMREHNVKRSKLYETMARDWLSAVATPPKAEHKRQSIALQGVPVQTKANKPSLELVVCSDFDCPFSMRGTATIRTLLGDPRYQGELAYHFLHFPLPMHKNAEIAHRAAIAAANQGRFWDMHDLLFADQKKRDRAELEDMARFLGLDVQRFRKDLDSAQTKAKLAADIKTCSTLGVSGTPNFFINGRSMKGAVPEAWFVEVFDEELAGGFERKP